jgi:hypothetical protein
MCERQRASRRKCWHHPSRHRSRRARRYKGTDRSRGVRQTIELGGQSDRAGNLTKNLVDPVACSLALGWEKGEVGGGKRRKQFPGRAAPGRSIPKHLPWRDSSSSARHAQEQAPRARISSTKSDGDDRKAFTRSGLNWFSNIAGAFDVAGQAIIDGEVVVVHDGRTNFSELQADSPRAIGIGRSITPSICYRWTARIAEC